MVFNVRCLVIGEWCVVWCVAAGGGVEWGEVVWCGVWWSGVVVQGREGEGSGGMGMYVCASCLQVVEWGGGAGAHASATSRSLRTKGNS